MSYILIVFLATTHSGDSVAIKFNNKENCEAAREAIIDTYLSGYYDKHERDKSKCIRYSKEKADE